MLISKSWLFEFIDIDADTNTICERLTALGLEVESVETAAPLFSKVVTGKIISLEQHPDADKLRVAKVNIGEEESIQIVCGAKNATEGMISPVALVGAVLPGNFKIKKSKLRGVVSNGMICSASELGLEEKSSGIMALPKETKIGQDIRSLLDLDDEMIEIGLTPNRGDCASILGVAKELSVAFNTPLKELKTTQLRNESDKLSIKIHLDEPSACPIYYTKKISGIDNSHPSPFWLVEKLRRVGLRSLSPLVDITNLVMIEMGVPMHAFNSQAIDGDIHIRMAKKDEELTLIDGKKVSLLVDDLVIADDNKVIALAGIMGGENSAVDEKTHTVLLESAWFSPSAIAGKARRINLNTEASFRFERGVDFKLQQQAIEKATQLILDICGGTAHQLKVAKEEEKIPSRNPISLDAKIVSKRLGISIKKEKITEILRSLNMTVEDSNEILVVTPPSYRFDISLQEDLIEEVARVWGYDNIPIASVNYNKIPYQEEESISLKRQINRLLNYLGYDEAITYSFIDKELAHLFNENSKHIELINPISNELSVMRSLVLPSLLKTLVYNMNRQQSNVKLYEVGNSYKQSESGFDCTEKFAGIASGLKNSLQWGYKNHVIDFFDVKGELEQLFEKIGVLDDISFKKTERSYLHPGQSADIIYNKKVIGYIGSLNPTIEKQFDLPNKAIAFEFESNIILGKKITCIEPITKYPEVRRDLSMLLAQSYPSDEILNSIAAIDDKLIKSVNLFDVYVGRNIPKNTKSMAIAIYLKNNNETLKDEEVDQLINKIVMMLKERFNAQLRG